MNYVTNPKSVNVQFKEKKKLTIIIKKKIIQKKTFTKKVIKLYRYTMFGVGLG